MINRGILQKSFRESLPPTVIVAAAALIAQVLLVFGVSVVAADMGDQWAKIGFVRKIFQAILGTEITDGFTPATLGAIVWVHPIVLIIVLSHPIVTASRIPAGETDRGTIDVLATLPVSRWTLTVSDSLVGTAGGGIVLLMLLCGNRLGIRLADADMVFPTRAIVATMLNFYVLYLAAAGIVRLFSSLLENRGRAIGVSLGLLVLSLLISFLAQFWPVAKSFSFLSVLEYYKPLEIASSGAWPVSDLVVLGVFAIVSWTAAGVAFQRRDLHVL